MHVSVAKRHRILSHYGSSTPEHADSERQGTSQTTLHITPQVDEALDVRDVSFLSRVVYPPLWIGRDDELFELLECVRNTKLYMFQDSQSHLSVGARLPSAACAFYVGLIAKTELMPTVSAVD